jgi:hypothetical protein
MFCAKVCHAAKFGLGDYWGLFKLDNLARGDADIAVGLLLREKTIGGRSAS